MRRDLTVVTVTTLLAGLVISAQAQTGGQQTASSAAPSSGSSSGASGGSGPAQGPYGGSAPSQAVPGVLPLSLQDAIGRGLKQNLGLLLANSDVRSAGGQRW